MAYQGANVQSLGRSSDIARDLDMLAEITKRNLGCDMVFVSVKHQNRLHSVGLDLESATYESNRVHKTLDTVCARTITLDGPLSLFDARVDPEYKKLAYVAEGPIVAYLGVPLRDAGHNAIGAICAIQKTPRAWQKRDADFLERLSTIVSSLVSKELQGSELDVLHKGLQEADLVAMSLAQGISSPVSVHDSLGTVLFSSLPLTRLVSERELVEVANKLILANWLDAKQAPGGEDTAPLTEVEQLTLRSGEKKAFHVRMSSPSEEVYFFEWNPVQKPILH